MSWEWRNVEPSLDEILAQLKSLPPVFGVNTIDYAAYVVPIPGSEKVKKLNPQNGQQYTTTDHVTKLYMSVAGRLQMLRAACEENEWRSSFAPVGTGRDLIEIRDTDSGEKTSVLYRVELIIWAVDDKPEYPLYVRSGQSYQVGQHSVEKAETAAMGRAIAALGLGVLPGSGVASMEEMAAVAWGESAGGPVAPKTREDLISDIESFSAQIMESRERTAEEQAVRVAAFIDKMGVRKASQEIDGKTVIDWAKLRDGQLLSLGAQLKQALSNDKE